MIRGKTIFKCDHCDHKFLALDIEYMAMCFSMPACCPKCQSRHTMPLGGDKRIYKSIWKNMD